MKKISKAIVDANLRVHVFADLDMVGKPQYQRINDRQYGTIITDANGVERYVRIGVIVAEERKDRTARELMQAEIDAYNASQEKKAEKLKASAEKAEKDKAKREAAKGEESVWE